MSHLCSAEEVNSFYLYFFIVNTFYQRLNFNYYTEIDKFILQMKKYSDPDDMNKYITFCGAA